MRFLQGPRRQLQTVGALVLCAVLLALPGCASTSKIIAQARMSPGQKLDPWENWNRKVFSFNEKVDENILKPVAIAYRDMVPSPVRTAIDNVFGNVHTGWSAINLFFQGRVQEGVQDSMHFMINSVLGIGGLIDIASEAGMEHHAEDMGKTLGRWGFGSGAYIVWPLFGPSSVRGTFALPLDRLASPSLVFNDGKTQFSIFTLDTVNTRANYLRATQMMDDIALDKYTFMRDAYLTLQGSLNYEDEGMGADPANETVPEKSH